MTSAHRIFAAAIALSLLAACGQSGALYLPGNPSDVQQTPATAPANEEEDDEPADAAP